MPLIGFASPKGGVGKTTVAAHVAGLLAAAGHPVLAVDCDPQNSLGLHFGLRLADQAGWLRETASGMPAWRALPESARPVTPRLRYAPSGKLSLAATLDVARQIGEHPEAVLRAFEDAASMQIVVADFAPGASTLLASLLPRFDLLVSVLLADPSSLAQIDSVQSGDAFGLADGMALPPERVVFVLNQYEILSRLGRVAGPAAKAQLGERLLGTVHRDENVREAAAAQRLVGDYASGARAALDLHAVTQAILGILPGPDSARQAA